MGYEVCEATVGNILGAAGVLPSEERMKKTTGKQFVRSYLSNRAVEMNEGSLSFCIVAIEQRGIGHYSYYGITGNIRSLSRLRFESAEEVAKLAGALRP